MRDFFIFLVGMALGMVVMLFAAIYDFIKRISKW